MFWTEWDVGDQYAKSSIVRANMDGTNLRRILYQDVFWPNSLVVDYVTQRIFYVDAKTGLIESSDFGEFLFLTYPTPFFQSSLPLKSN
jgi:hypothetical protein